MSKPRPCSAQTKAGKPCGSFAITGSEYCTAHQPREWKESRGIGGPQEGSGRPRKPRLLDELRRRVEEETEQWIKALTDARDSDDPDLALKAFREAFDRVYGRPKQQTELSGPDGGPVVLTVADLAERAAAELDKEEES